MSRITEIGDNSKPSPAIFPTDKSEGEEIEVDAVTLIKRDGQWEIPELHSLITASRNHQTPR